MDVFDLQNEQKRELVDFTIELPGKFKFTWKGKTDVSTLDLTDTISCIIKDGYCASVEMYPDESTKPSVGTELNKPCTIEMSAKKGFKPEKIKASFEKSGGTNVYYNPTSGLHKSVLSKAIPDKDGYWTNLEDLVDAAFSQVDVDWKSTAKFMHDLEQKSAKDNQDNQGKIVKKDKKDKSAEKKKKIDTLVAEIRAGKIIDDEEELEDTLEALGGLSLQKFQTDGEQALSCLSNVWAVKGSFTGREKDGWVLIDIDEGEIVEEVNPQYVCEDCGICISFDGKTGWTTHNIEKE